jgi:hypothetical protein
MLPLHESVPRSSTCVTIQTQSVYEHVCSIIPPSLQGTKGVIQLITTFIGTTYKWVRVIGDIDQVYANRHVDLYFLFWVCSHRLPIPYSLDTLRSNWYRTDTARRLVCIDKGSQMLPVGKCGLYYTRSGHLGTSEDLSRLIRTVSCRGYVTTIEPELPRLGVHAIVTNRPHHWVDRTSNNICIIHVDDVHTLSPDLYWDCVILDHIKPSTPSVCYRHPDDRHLSGSISPDVIRVDNAFHMRKRTIVYAESPESTIDLIECMFILQTFYIGELFIGKKFTRAYASFVRLTETMLLEGILI